MYSTEEFIALSNAIHDNELTNDFWYVVDHLSLEHLILWSERLTKTKYLSDKSGEHWLDLIDLISIAKLPMNYILTTKQKRYMSMLVLSCWLELEIDYVL